MPFFSECDPITFETDVKETKWRKVMDDEITATSCACQAIWLRRILEDLHFKQEGATVIYCDNSSTIKLSKNLVLHGCSKHIDVKFHYLRDLTNAGTINLIHCKSKEQTVDGFTKPLKFPAFQNFRKQLGVCALADPD